jgi:peroxiredoxin
LAIAGLALGIAFSGCRPEQSGGGVGGPSGGVAEEPSGSVLGRPAPDFTFPDVAGGTVTLSELRGNPVLLDFGASWCEPCAVAAPHLQALHEKYEGDGLQVIGISLDGSPNQARAFVKQHGTTFPTLWADPNSEAVQELAKAINLGPIPRTLLIDSKGVLRADLEGFYPLREMERELIRIGITARP